MIINFRFTRPAPGVYKLKVAGLVVSILRMYDASSGSLPQSGLVWWVCEGNYPGATLMVKEAKTLRAAKELAIEVIAAMDARRG